MLKLKNRMIRLNHHELLKTDDWRLSHSAIIKKSFTVKEKKRFFLPAKSREVHCNIIHHFIDLKDDVGNISDTYHVIHLETEEMEGVSDLMIKRNGVLMMPFSTDDGERKNLNIAGHIPFIHFNKKNFIIGDLTQDEVDKRFSILMNYIYEFFDFKQGIVFAPKIEEEVYSFGLSYANIYNEKLSQVKKDRKNKLTFIQERSILNMDIIKDIHAHKRNEIFIGNPPTEDWRTQDV